MQMICELSHFDLKSFIKETIKSRSSEFEPDFDEGTEEFYVICPDDYVSFELTEWPGRDIEEELVKNHYKIFFPFASFIGQKYTLGATGMTHRWEENEPESSIFGYLVYVQDGDIHLETVNYYPPESDIEPNIIRKDDYDKEDIGLGMLVYPYKFIKHSIPNPKRERFFKLITDGREY